MNRGKIVEFEFYGNITLEDYIQYSKYIYRNKKNNKYLIGTAFIIIIIYSITKLIKYFQIIKLNNNYIDNIKDLAEENNLQIIGLISAPSSFSIIFEVILPIVLFTLLLFSLYFLYNFIFDNFIFNKICTKYYNANKFICEYQIYKINNEKIIITSDSEFVTITNDKILKIVYDKDSLYIFIGLNTAYLIKKRFFDNDEIYNSFITFMKENYKACQDPSPRSLIPSPRSL
jgi:hypothetical protein